VKSNPELLDRLDRVELMVTDAQKATDAWCSRTADDEERTTKENNELKRVMVVNDQEIETLSDRLDDSYGNIHSLQVQNHMLKMEIQNRDMPDLMYDGEDEDEDEEEAMVTPDPMAGLKSIPREEMKAFVLFCTDRQPYTAFRCETMSVLLFDEWNMLTDTEKQVFYK